MKKIILTLMFLSVSVLFADSKCDYLDKIDQKNYTKKDLFCIYQDFYETISKKLPQKIDNSTSLINVTYNKDGITYIHQINQELSLTQEQIFQYNEAFKENVKSKICFQDNMKQLFKIGFVLNHIYYDATNKPVFSYSIVEKDCK